MRIILACAGVSILLLSGCRSRTETTTTQTSTRPKASSTKAPRVSSSSSNDGNLLLGNASSAAQNPDNVLLQRAEYSLSYNRSRGGPNWVAWHVDESDLGDIERGTFRPDPDLPSDSQIRPNDYKGSGFDRGHMCPSGDRTNTREANNATFYLSNIVPQTADLNQHAWADFEGYVRAVVRQGFEAYQITGAAGNAGTIADGEVTVPQVCWKVVVFLPLGNRDKSRINAQTRIIALGMPNVEDPALKAGDWRRYITSASKIERATKLNLLSSLPDDVERQLEAKIDSGR